jgi:hypothetical protein
VQRLIVARSLGFVTLSAVALAAGFTPGTGAAGPDDKSPKTTRLTVVHDNNHLPSPILVSLCQDGKIIRSRELKYFFDDTVTWEKLRPGPYEVHFEANGYEKCVKRIQLTEDDAAAFKVYAQIDKKAVIVGGGVSVQEVLDRLTQLKKENAELRARVEALEAEVKRLKK